MVWIKGTLAAVGALVLGMAFNIAINLLRQSVERPAAGEPSAWLILTGAVIGMVAAVALAWAINRFLFRGMLSADLDLLPLPSRRDWVFWTGWGFALMAIIIGSYAVLGLLDVKVVGAASLGYALLMSFSRAVFPGFVEEIAYRYLSFGIMRRFMPTWIAIVLSGAFFGAIHINEMEMMDVSLRLAAGGLFTAMLIMLYLKTGSLWPAILIHTIWDLFVLGHGINWLNTTTAADEHYRTHAEYLQLLVTSDNQLLSGGPAGVEAGLIAIPVTGAATYLLWKGRIGAHRAVRPSQG